MLAVTSAIFNPCVPGIQSIDKYSKTFAALDGIVDVGVKLATTLAGFGAAILLGLKTGLNLSIWVRVAVLIATFLFAELAFYALWWRFGLAEIWLNECLDLVTAPRFQLRFQAHFIFFFFGLVSFGIVAVVAALSTPTSKPGENS